MTTNETKLPPKSKSQLIKGSTLAKELEVLIGQTISLKGQTRTIGANLRKKIQSLVTKLGLTVADKESFSFSTRKGLPKLMLIASDSYIVTSGDKYNLQVWNRNPNSQVPLIKFKNGTKISCKDIRCILVKVNTTTEKIETIAVLTPEYIEKHFGKFGTPTIKYQLIINATIRQCIISAPKSMLIGQDTNKMKLLLAEKYTTSKAELSDEPIPGKIFPISVLKNRVASKLIGLRLNAKNTKNRGQELERIVANLLGYNTASPLVGGYPDIKNQALEIKVQESPTIDLGKETPSIPSKPFTGLDITTEDVRYLIALTDPSSKIIKGVVLLSGSDIVEKFSLVGDTSYKCQRTIPMDFFNKHKGKSVYNP